MLDTPINSQWMDSDTAGESCYLGVHSSGGSLLRVSHREGDGGKVRRGSREVGRHLEGVLRVSSHREGDSDEVPGGSSQPGGDGVAGCHRTHLGTLGCPQVSGPGLKIGRF